VNVNRSSGGGGTKYALDQRDADALPAGERADLLQAEVKRTEECIEQLRERVYKLQIYLERTEDDLEYYQDRAEQDAWVKIECYMMQTLRLAQGAETGKQTTGSRQVGPRETPCAGEL
jgi:hypothetical protein